ncbi:hypothetical protein BASA84_000732 [Batrachochytrium salamandrivorans]|nr:hypothetical protein BASA84_000732 [Batrachochytrium salamandrivorans]
MGSAFGTMILAKVPNSRQKSVDSRICLVGHSGATTNYSRKRLLLYSAIPRRVVSFDNNHPVSHFGDWNTDPTAPSAHVSTRGVMV